MTWEGAGPVSGKPAPHSMSDTTAPPGASSVEYTVTATTGQAHTLLSQGLHPFTVDHPAHESCIGAHSPTKPCDGKRGKHPTVAWGTWAQTVTPQMIELAWHKRSGLFNIGIACGPSNLVVLDEDEHGELARWLVTYGVTLPDTYTVTTGRGFHYYFRWDHVGQRINNCEKVFDGFSINVRGHGGFVVAEGSVHESGAVYAGNGQPIAPLPAEVANLLLTQRSSQQSPQSTTNGDSASAERRERVDYQNTMIPFHKRHGALVAYAGRLRRMGLDYEEAVPVFRQRWLLCEQPTGQIPEARFHTDACEKPATWAEAEARLRDVYDRYAAGGTDFGPEEEGGSESESTPAIDLDPKLAAGHRKRAHNLATRYAGKLMHVHGLGWHHWDDKRWLEVRTGHAERAVMHILDAEMRAALRMPDGPDRKAVIRVIASASSANGISSILTVASKLSEFAYTVDDLDAAPHLLNTPAATINLDTMTAQRHDPGDRITKITRGDYSHSAFTGSRWATFIAEVLPDQHVRRYLQKLLGAALFGEVVHDVLVILNGEGRNGKSALVEAVVHALDGYGVTTTPGLLMERHYDTHPTELMSLRGARLAVAAETQKGRRLDAEKMKRLTGGDTITARKIARDEVSWRPTHTLLLATNDLPVVDSRSVAVWERLRVIPFTETFTEGSGRQDAGLRARLRDEPDAVLTWAVDGWKAYVEDGRRLTPIPAAVTAALDQYRADSDPVGTAVAQFVGDCCAVSPANKIATRELFEKGYEIWRREIAEAAPVVDVAAFGQALHDAGHPATRGRGGVRMRQGITLKPQEMWRTDGGG
jgi:putative DNA primase/helicase